jgi:hypothetical protein
VVVQHPERVDGGAEGNWITKRIFVVEEEAEGTGQAGFWTDEARTCVRRGEVVVDDEEGVSES